MSLFLPSCSNFSAFSMTFRPLVQSFQGSKLRANGHGFDLPVFFGQVVSLVEIGLLGLLLYDSHRFLLF